MGDNNTQLETSAGVEALIQRLKDDGILAGQKKAEALVAEAEKRAEWLVEQAKQEAASIREQSQKDIERLKQSGLDALHLAARDAGIALREELIQQIENEFKALISQTFQDKNFLEQSLQKIMLHTCDKANLNTDHPVDMTVKNTIGLSDEQLNQLALSLSSEMLSKGISIKTEDVCQGLSIPSNQGIYIQVKNRGLELDFSDDALGDILLAYLQPRFRDLLRGVFHP